MKKLFILGGSILQLPAVKKGKELGYRVAVADQNPHAIARGYADDFYLVSTIDIEKVTQAAAHFEADGVMTLASDMPMRSVAAACTSLDLPGIDAETALRATDKGVMRQALAANHVAIPWFFVVANKEEWESQKQKVRLPCVIKPTDNSGSRGVTLVEEESQLEAAYAYSVPHSRTGAVIVEEYMSGSEVSVETISVDGVVHVLAVTDKVTTGAPYFVETGHSQPSRLPQEDIAKIKSLASQAVAAIGIQNGPAHVEIMSTSNGPKVVELGARMGGDNITTHLVPLSTGIDMLAAVIQLSCGEPVELTPQWEKGSAIRYIPSQPGTLLEIRGLEAARQVEGIQEVVVTKETGTQLTSVRNSAERLGFIIAQAETAQAAVAACERALAHIQVEVAAEEIPEQPIRVKEGQL